MSIYLAQLLLVRGFGRIGGACRDCLLRRRILQLGFSKLLACHRLERRAGRDHVAAARGRIRLRPDTPSDLSWLAFDEWLVLEGNRQAREGWFHN